MAFWKGLQTQVAHHDIVDMSDIRKRWEQTIQLDTPGEPTWTLSRAMREACAGTWTGWNRFYIDDALFADGCRTRMLTSTQLAVTIHKEIDVLEFIEFSGQIPSKASIQFDAGCHVPLAHWGGGRFGLESQFPMARDLDYHSVMVLFFEFVKPIELVQGKFTQPIGLQWMSVRSLDSLQIIPVYAGHAKDNEDTAFLCTQDGCVRALNKIDTLRWIAQKHEYEFHAMMDNYAMVWQRRWRKRHMAREVYAHTNLPRDMCWIVGAYASGGANKSRDLSDDQCASPLEEAAAADASMTEAC
jgi:hypothetical protein